MDTRQRVTYVDDVTDSLFYVGRALVGSKTSDPVWQIQKFTTTGGVMKQEFVDGSQDSRNAWDDRTGLNYS